MNCAIQIAVASAFNPVPPMSQNAELISGISGHVADAALALASARHFA
jgi:hypothetical protein